MYHGAARLRDEVRSVGYDSNCSHSLFSREFHPYKRRCLLDNAPHLRISPHMRLFCRAVSGAKRGN